MLDTENKSSTQGLDVFLFSVFLLKFQIISVILDTFLSLKNNLK